MKLELKHVLAYAEHGVLVQYNGIINGKEISTAQKEAEKLKPENWLEESTCKEYNEALEKVPVPQYGIKHGLIKKVEIYLKHWCLRVGNGHKWIGPGSFVDEDGAKLVLRPISDFQEKVDGVSFSDMITHGYHNEFWTEKHFKVEHLYHHDFELLASRHADMWGLIEAGLAVDVNTLNQ